MAKLQFNPNTQRVLFNPDTKRVLMVSGECEHCTAFGKETPANIKVTFSGILSCQGIVWPNCCPGAEQLRAQTSYGICNDQSSWYGAFVLDQGRVDIEAIVCPPGIPCWRNNASEIPCQWWAISKEDYGGYDTYHLGECQGGIDFHTTYDYFVTKVNVYTQAEELRVAVSAYLCHEGEVPGCRQIFHAIKNCGSSPSACFPYGQTINNEDVCEGGDNECIGEGTAVITQWPPP